MPTDMKQEDVTNLTDAALAEYIQKLERKGKRLTEEERKILEQLTTYHVTWNLGATIEEASRQAGFEGQFPAKHIHDNSPAITTQQRVGLDNRAKTIANRVANAQQGEDDGEEAFDWTLHPGFVQGGPDSGTTIGRISSQDPQEFEGDPDARFGHH